MSLEEIWELWSQHLAWADHDVFEMGNLTVDGESCILLSVGWANHCSSWEGMWLPSL
jgi:hypothetical protein